jgi:hypothetical protein
VRIDGTREYAWAQFKRFRARSWRLIKLQYS